MSLCQLIELYSLQKQSGYHDVENVFGDAHTDIVTPHQVGFQSRYLHTVSVITLGVIANRKIQHKSLFQGLN